MKQKKSKKNETEKRPKNESKKLKQKNDK